MNETLRKVKQLAADPARLRAVYPDHVMDENGVCWYVLAYENSDAAFTVARAAGDSGHVVAVWQNDDFGGFVVAVYCTDEQISKFTALTTVQTIDTNLGVDRVVEQRNNPILASWNWRTQ